MVCVAQVGAPHGVRGAFRVRCFTEAPENVTRYGPLCDERGQPVLELRVLGPAKGGIIAAAPGVTDRNAAEALRGRNLYVPRDRLPPPGEEEYYHADLVGLAARDRDGRVVGRVLAVLNHGAGGILEIPTPDVGGALVPFPPAHVPAVDLAARTLEVVLP